MARIRDPSSELRIRIAWTENRVIPGDMLGGWGGNGYVSAGGVVLLRPVGIPQGSSVAEWPLQKPHFQLTAGTMFLRAAVVAQGGT